MNELFYEIHSRMPRQGPGSNASTRRAFDMLSDVPEHAHILDIGCGPGMQAVNLARLSNGRITAVDNHQPYLEHLMEHALEAGVQDRISAIRGSMYELPFRDASFDLVWSEGAIYIMGFEEGLCSWKRLLKDHGYIAVTEATWLRDNPPEELKQFWDDGYPAMTTVEGNRAIAKHCGYDVIGDFVLPENDWWDDYYRPLEQRIAAMEEKYPHDPMAIELLDLERFEMDLYRRYSDWYGYVFYILQKT